MLLMMAWMFWFFCSREKRNDEVEDFARIDGHALKDNDLIGVDVIKTYPNSNTKEVVEEDVEISIINLDESETPFSYDCDGLVVKDRETRQHEEDISFINFDKSEDNFAYDDVVMEEIVSPIIENFEYNDFSYDINREVSSAFIPIKDYPIITCNNEEFLTPSLKQIEGAEKGTLDYYVPDHSHIPLDLTKANKVKLSPTKVIVKNEAAGRIHSIVVKGEEKKKLRIRSTSPRICMHQDNLIHENHQDNEVLRSNIENHERHEVEPQIENVSESLNKSSLETEDNCKEEMNVKLEIGKLENFNHQKNEDSRGKNAPSAKLTDFDKVMRSRKKHTDTIDKVANVFGNLGHRDEKIGSVNNQKKMLSKNWAKLKDAVRRKQYTTFVTPPPKDPSTFML